MPIRSVAIGDGGDGIVHVPAQIKVDEILGTVPAGLFEECAKSGETCLLPQIAEWQMPGQVHTVVK